MMQFCVIALICASKSGYEILLTFSVIFLLVEVGTYLLKKGVI